MISNAFASHREQPKAALVGGLLVALWLSEFGADPFPTPVAGFEIEVACFDSLTFLDEQN
jgi:hypothetical protein